MATDLNQSRALAHLELHKILTDNGWKAINGNYWRYQTCIECDNLGLFVWRHRKRVGGMAWDSLPRFLVDGRRIIFDNGFLLLL